MPITPFQDGNITSIGASLGGAYGEPTMLLSDDGTQIDAWFGFNNHIYYSHSSDGVTFSGFTVTSITAGYFRSHCLKDNGTYYLYAANTGDTSIHVFTSTDKVTFTDQGQVLGVGSGWDGSHVANTFVWREGANWYMLYEANGTGNYKIGLATASSPTGPWTRYASNPVLGLPTYGGGNPELPRFQSTVTTYGGKYYCYFHNISSIGASTIQRAYSTDLHTWTIEGQIDGVWQSNAPAWNGSSGWSYGDHCLVTLNGKTFLYWSPSDQVSQAHIDGATDNRTEVQLMAVPPFGAVPWYQGSAKAASVFG